MHWECCRKSEHYCHIPTHNNLNIARQRHSPKEYSSDPDSDTVLIDSSTNEDGHSTTEEDSSVFGEKEKKLLQGNYHLNDVVINTCMERLNNCTQESRINRVFATSTFLYPALQKLEFQKKMDMKTTITKNTCQRIKTCLNMTINLLSPVNIDNTHWILMAIDLVFLELIIYDSLIMQRQ